MEFFKKSKSIQEKCILVVSKDTNHLDEIFKYLSLKGLDSIKTLLKHPLEIISQDIKWDLQAVILDGIRIDNTQEYCFLIQKFFSKNIPCIVLANNDSIKISQFFLEQGIFYLDWETQIEQIYEKIFHFEESIQNKKSIKISVLGTKGGVGNSFLTYHLSKIVLERFHSLVLNVQGADSSFNLDLITSKVFEKEYEGKNEVSLFRESKEEAYHYHNPKHMKFNFIFYDHSIQGLPKENIETILNESDTIVLTLNQELDSIRKAKEVLRINEFLLSVAQGAKKIFIVLNQNQPMTKNSFEIKDLEELLEANIHLVVPYQAIDKSQPASLPKGKTLKSLQGIVDMLVGATSKRSKKWI